MRSPSGRSCNTIRIRKACKSARRAVAEYYSHRGADVSIEDILLTTSTSEAYSFVFRMLCDPGDEILVPAPSYPLFDFLADIQDVKLLPYPLLYDHGWQIDFHALEAGDHRPFPRCDRRSSKQSHRPFHQAERIAGAQCDLLELGTGSDRGRSVSRFRPARRSRRFSFAANRDALTFTLSGLSKIADSRK